jgi:Fe-S cluster biogenesis protein NfuA
MESVSERVRAVLRRLGPALSVDGGGVELERIEGDTAYVRLTGACVGCPGADITLKYGLESAVTEDVPEIARVVAIEPDDG